MIGEEKDDSAPKNSVWPHVDSEVKQAVSSSRKV